MRWQKVATLVCNHSGSGNCCRNPVSCLCGSCRIRAGFAGWCNGSSGSTGMTEKRKWKLLNRSLKIVFNALGVAEPEVRLEGTIEFR